VTKPAFTWFMCREEGAPMAVLAVVADGRAYWEPFPVWLLEPGDQMDLCFRELEICWIAERDSELWRRA